VLGIWIKDWRGLEFCVKERNLHSWTTAVKYSNFSSSTNGGMCFSSGSAFTNSSWRRS